MKGKGLPIVGNQAYYRPTEKMTLRNTRRLAQLPFRGDLDQFTRDLANAAFHARLARLPVAAAEPVEIDDRFLRAVA